MVTPDNSWSLLLVLLLQGSLSGVCMNSWGGALSWQCCDSKINGSSAIIQLSKWLSKFSIPVMSCMSCLTCINLIASSKALSFACTCIVAMAQHWIQSTNHGMTSSCLSVINGETIQRSTNLACKQWCMVWVRLRVTSACDDFPFSPSEIETEGSANFAARSSFCCCSSFCIHNDEPFVLCSGH